MIRISHVFSGWLFAPHSRVTDLENIQRSRLLSTILLVIVVVATTIIILVLQSDPDDINEPTVRGGILLTVIILFMYMASRLGYTNVPVTTVIISFTAVFIYIPFYSGESAIFLAFLLIPIIFTAIFFSIRWTAITSFGILILVSILIAFVDQALPNSPYWDFRNMWYFLMLSTGLILTFRQHLGNLEELRQQELKRINEQLERQVAELERFTYTVSHELKTPIVTIKGFLGSIEHDLQNGKYEKAQKDFLRVTRATDNMYHTLSDLLELSRIGRVMNLPEGIDLHEIVREALEAVSNRISSHAIQVNVSPDLPTAYGDRARLREVFENLIDNAAKYMGNQPAPLIEIGHRSGTETIFYVKDNGIGIEPRYWTRIFGLFEKLNPISEGTGIGLALVKRIIETHGGKVWVESDGLGKGSTFCFTIPDGKEKK